MNNKPAILSLFIIWARIFVYKFFCLNKRTILTAFYECEKAGLNNIPIFIISFNRLSYIKIMIKNLERMNLTNIHIIDNASTYQPLLNYYKTIPYKIHYLRKNLGHLAFWKDNQFSQFRNDFYVVTDPDLEFIKDCPKDIISKMFYTLKKYPFLKKVGVSLKIDDIQENAIFKNEIKKFEESYYKVKLSEDNVYYAGVDTTFALYIPDSICITKDFFRAMRLGYPYQARHLPWYKTKENLTDEDYYYSNHKTNGWWDVAKSKVTYD